MNEDSKGKLRKAERYMSDGSRLLMFAVKLAEEVQETECNLRDALPINPDAPAWSESQARISGIVDVVDELHTAVKLVDQAREHSDAARHI